MRKIFLAVLKFNDLVGIISLLLMCAVIFFQIIARYIFAHAVPWPEEAGRLFFIIATYASMVYCMRMDGHLRIEILQTFLPASKRILEFLSLACTGIYFLFSFYLLSRVFKVVYRVGAKFVTIPLPLWTIWAAIMFFCLLIAIVALVMVIRLGRHETPAIEEQQ